MYKRYIAQTIFALTMLISTPTWAETEQAGPQLAYFTLEPDLTTNFYTKGKKLGYVQVRIDIMVMSQQDLTIVEHHQPLIRRRHHRTARQADRRYHQVALWSGRFA